MNAKILTGKLKLDGDSGDGKRQFVVANNNNGWEDLRIEVDTDDCDSKYAKAFMNHIIKVVNAAADSASKGNSED
jgi:hypothetical protein